MEYERVPMRVWELADILPPGVSLYRAVELPVFEIKVDKWKCKIPDIRCLNEMAVDVFEGCINCASDERGAEEARFQIPDGFPEDKLSLIIDILMAMKINGQKRGDGSFTMNFLVRGARIEGDDLILEMSTDNARAIYDFCKSKKQEKVNYFDIAAAVVRRFVSEDRVEMLEAIQQEES